MPSFFNIYKIAWIFEKQTTVRKKKCEHHLNEAYPKFILIVELFLLLTIYKILWNASVL